MEKIQYPKWKYHAEKEACIVAHEAAEKALGADWVDSPAHVKKPVAAPEKSQSVKPAKSFKVGASQA